MYSEWRTDCAVYRIEVDPRTDTYKRLRFNLNTCRLMATSLRCLYEMFAIWIYFKKL